MKTMADFTSPATSTSLTEIRAGFVDVKFAADGLADLLLEQFADALDSEAGHVLSLNRELLNRRIANRLTKQRFTMQRLS